MKEIDISNALRIEGWMSEEELFWLAWQAQQHKLIVEIGCYLGRSTRALADHCSGTVIAIDDFAGPRDTNEKYDSTALLSKYLENVPNSNVVTLMSDHECMSCNIYPDMVFIDGSHEYKDVKRDIERWLLFLQDGGLLCGHDYDENWPGVTDAVNELLGEHVHRVEGTRIWERIL